MIDWLTFKAPLAHQAGIGGPFFAGEVLSTIPDPTDPEGYALDWGVLKRKAMPGSHSSMIQVQSTTDEEGRSAVWVSGNPAKWFQGHNIFGTDDLAGLVLEMLHRVCASVGLVPSADDLALWAAGRIRLSRVDVTSSFDLGNLPRVRSALRALDASANLKHRGRGTSVATPSPSGRSPGAGPSRSMPRAPSWPQVAPMACICCWLKRPCQSTPMGCSVLRFACVACNWPRSNSNGFRPGETMSRRSYTVACSMDSRSQRQP